MKESLPSQENRQPTHTSRVSDRSLTAVLVKPYLVDRRSQEAMTNAMQSIFFYAGAALAEIAGCFAFWAWLRMSKSPLWLVPGCISLVVFAYLLTKVDSADAGRAYAAYGGIYITFAVLWLWAAEGVHPDRWDLGGTALCLMGAAVIFFGPHRA